MKKSILPARDAKIQGTDRLQALDDEDPGDQISVSLTDSISSDDRLSLGGDRLLTSDPV